MVKDSPDVAELREKLVIAEPVVVPGPKWTRADQLEEDRLTYEEKWQVRLRRWWRSTRSQKQLAVRHWVIAHRGLISQETQERYDSAMQRF